MNADTKNEIIKNFTGEPEHRIRESCGGKKNSKSTFNWKFKDETET